MEQDTTPAARRRYLEFLRSKSEVERLEMAAALSEAAREMTRAGIRMRNPGISEDELREEFMWIVYGIRRPRQERK